jgi:hypothetical protein
MKKKDWGNAVWLLFHTLAAKLKEEFPAELPILVSHITQICNHLPCPDCQQHASQTMAQVNKTNLASSKEALIDFLWRFHNDVNKRNRGVLFAKEALDKYKTANTYNVIKNFIAIMNATSNNEKTMLHGFHRGLYMKQFITYANNNLNKYNP